MPPGFNVYVYALATEGVTVMVPSLTPEQEVADGVAVPVSAAPADTVTSKEPEHPNVFWKVMVWVPEVTLLKVLDACGVPPSIVYA